MGEREGRPSPEALLAAARQEGRGRLKIFLGAAPGVGKTYEMLQSAQAKRREGVDVVIGIVEPHGRRETEALLDGLETIPAAAGRVQGPPFGRDGSRRDPEAAPAARAGRRAGPHQRPGHPPPQALSRCRGADRRRHRRIRDVEHPACREPQRRDRPDHPDPGARDRARQRARSGRRHRSGRPFARRPDQAAE